jgi:sugar phosphate isomerase/epimerase
MPRMQIGVVLESLGRPLREGLRLASALGVAGVQIDAAGPLAPEQLSQTGRKEFRHLLRSLNLELTALGCPLRHGFDVEAGLDRRIAYVQSALTLAYDLGPRVVIACAGLIPEDEQQPARQFLQHGLTAVGRHGERVGATLALEAGLEAPGVLKALLGRITPGGLAVHVDPATLLGRGHDPAAAVREFATLVVHAQARDTRPHRPDRDAQEVPLGGGDVDWTAFLGALEEVGYHGWLTIKRGPSANPAADIQAGVALLQRLVGG